MTRMAPSPTGEYHIGHIRTVLYNYALAKKHDGSFIIRIEDTDRERLVDGATDRILNVIRDYGLSWDEGPQVGGPSDPYIQSQRLDIYKKHVDLLVKKERAYYCFCSKDELEEMRKIQQTQGLAKTMYDGRCRRLTLEQIKKNLKEKLPYVVRLKVPEDQQIKFRDEVYGELEFNSREVDDTVLLKSDGYPTYHLAVVVDDHLMKVTHVMRGNDWLPSTPKHVLLYQAFGWDMPLFVHLPNLKELGENKKLSKRYGAVYALDFLKEGYLVEVLLNFLMFLGWNPGGDKEIYSLAEFVSEFEIKRIHKTDLVAFDREKLLWMNGYYIRQLTAERLYNLIRGWAEKFEIDLHNEGFSDEYHVKVIGLVQERMKKLSEYVLLTHYFYQDPQVDHKQLAKFTRTEKEALKIASEFHTLYLDVKETDWQADKLEILSHEFVEKKGYKNKEAFMTVRIAVTGELATPPIFETMEALGKEVVLKRLKAVEK